MKTYKKYIASLGEETVRDLFEVRRADVSAQNPVFLGESLNANEIGLRTLDGILKENCCFRISDLAVNGKDLEEAGIKPSPEMGRILQTLLDEVMSDKLENNKVKLLERAKNIRDI